MRGLLCCAVALLLACDSQSALPPILEPGEGGGTLPICEPGDMCAEGTYCIAVADSGCQYLECATGAWTCVPDSGPTLDAATPRDATTEPHDASDASDASVASDTSVAPEDAPSDGPSDSRSSGQ